MSSDDIAKLRQTLISNGYYVTQARVSTFNLLVNLEPQSVSEILIKNHGSIDRVSIYRNLELFEKLGIAHRTYVGWKYKLELSDQFMAHHHHLSCLGCGKVIDIEDETHIDTFIQNVAAKFNFKPRYHQFEINGYCEACSRVTTDS